MAYVEIRRSDRLIARRPVDEDKARSGLRIRIGSVGEVRVALDRPAAVGDFEVRVFAGEPPRTQQGPEAPAPVPPTGAGTVSGDAGSMGGLDFSMAEPVSRRPQTEALPQIEGYRILEPIGHGGMGAVWRAQQLSTRREVALKLMTSYGSDRDKAQVRFAREVELTARLDHPHIGRIYDSGLCQGRCYYAMELVEGMPLDRYVQRMNLRAREVLSLVRTVCQAVHYAHLHGVIHRDLKPSNIMVGHDGQPHVLDFGLARSFLHEEEAVTISLEGEVAGTPAYMSPEQARGHQDQIDTRTDVFSLGVILFQLLTGRPPHDLSGSVYDVLQRVIEGRITRPREASRSIDRELEAILLRALATDPACRYASAGELADDIDNYLRGEPLRARVPTTLYFLSKRVRKHWRPVGLAAAVLAVILGIGVAAYTKVVGERAVGSMLARKLEIASEDLEKAGLTLRILGDDKKEAEAALGVLLDRYFAAENKVSDLNHQLGQRTPAVSARAIGLNPGMPLGPTALVRTPCLPGQVSSWTLETRAHRTGVARLAFSPDSRWLASVGQEGTIRLWEVQTGALSGILVDPNGPAADVGWSGHSSALMVLDAEGRTRWWVWDWPTRILAPVPASPEPSLARAAAGRSWPSPIDTGNPSADEVLNRWNVVLRGDRQALCRSATCMALSEDRRTLAVADADGVISFLDVRSGLPRVASASSWCGPVRSVAFSPQGDLFATCSGAGTLCLWDAHRWQPLLKSQAPTIGAGDPSMAGVFCWARDGNALAMAGDRAGVIDIMDVPSGRVVRTLSGDNQQITSVDWSADGGTLVAGSADGEVLVWDMGTPSTEAQREIALGGSKIRVALLQGDPILVAAVSSEGKLAVWDVRDGRLLHVLTNRAGAGACLAANPGGTALVSVGPDGMPCLWDPHRGELIRTLRSDPNRSGSGKPMPSAVVWSSDGSRLATGDSEGWISVWDPATGDVPRSFPTSCGSVTSLAWSGDGQLLLSGGSDGTARAWEVKNGYRHYATLLPLWGPMGVGVALSPEGDYRGPLGIDDHLAYIVRTDRGDATLSPTEFNAQHGWVNEPWQVGLYRPGAEPMERIYVKADAPGPFDGRTWATAFRDLQDALSAARPNTEIWVAQGVYTPDRGTGARIASFNLKNGVRLFGGFAGNETRVHERDPDRYETILSGDLNADDRPPFANNDENSYHVVTSRDLDPNTLLDGFAITGGNANGPKEGEYHHGGGVYSSWSGARYIRCVFRGNTARHWGGGFFGSNGNRCPELTDCRFIGNAATDVDEGAGGGLWASGGRYILRDCLFIGNTAGSWGGAICHELCAPHLVRCVLRGNAAPRGAGLANSHGTQAVIMNCVFAGNTSTVEGGGIYGYVGRAHLTNCLFVHNQGGGGAIYAHAQSHLVISNCTFSGNSHIGVYGDDTSTLVLANSILWANSSGEDWSESAQVSARLVTVNSCCVQGWTGRLGGADNVGLNPLFMDPNGPDGRIDTFDDDFRLRDDSLCRDIGDNSAVPADAFDLDRDGDPNEPIPFDVAGRPRIQNGRVDLGAHESDLPLSDR